LSISIIICTYNPDVKLLTGVFSALQTALNGITDYEVLVIDNNSSNNFRENISIGAYLKAEKWSVISETKQGLTPARLRGIVESKNELICFIDDDNFVGENFFKVGIQIANDYPFIGAWSGQVKLKFEVEPAQWTRKYWGMLVYRAFNSNKWSNLPHISESMPCGAGLFVRKQVAEYYFQLHEKGKRNIQLDRSGGSLFSGGDDDLATCSCDIGLGVGLFHELILEHYIPVKRTTQEYFLKLAEGIATSSIILTSFRNEVKPETVSFKRGLANFVRDLFLSKIDKEIQRAVRRGEKIGYQIVKSNTNS
jgi:glycosyltransferase involved in cell wall biosynthesis